MAASYRTQVDLNNNEILNMVVENLSATPATGEAGRLIYLTTDNKLYVHNGSAYVEITTSDSGDYQPVSEKDQANGYAGLDGSGKIVIGQIPTGTDANTVPMLAGTVSNGQSIIYDSGSGGFVAFDVSTLYTFRGSATSAQLDEYTATAQSGWVYNLTDQRTWNGNTYPAGTNWAYDAVESRWEPLTGIIDLSGYQTIANLVTSLTAESTDAQYPSAKAVYDEIQVVTAAATAAAAAAAAAVAANPPITAGTHTKITYDAKGLVTAGADLAASDIPDISSIYQAVSERNQADGYVGLNSESKVDIAYLPTGNGANLIPVPSAAGTAGQVLRVNTNADGFEFATIATETFLTKHTGQIAGDGSTVSWSFTHNLGTMPCAVTIFDTTGNIVYADVAANSTQVTVTMNPAPESGENFTVNILG